jgi:hypothetical protein
LKASNSNGSATQSFALTITSSPILKHITNKTASAGTQFTMTVSAKGSATPTFIVTGLPTGLSLTDNGDGTGSITGTPATGSGGSYAVTITTTNMFGSASQAFTLKVNEAPTITSNNSATVVIGSTFTFHVTSTGFPFPNVTKNGNLPAGISFKAATDTFSGTPKAGTSGNYPITITAKNSTGNVQQSFVLTVQ